MKNKILLFVCLAVAIGPMSVGVSHAAPITYYVDRTIGDGTVTGFIQTDGTLGSIGFGNFIDYELILTAPNFGSGSPAIINDEGAQYSYSYHNGVVNGANPNITATVEELLFDPTNTFLPSFILFWTDTRSHFWCIEARSCAGTAGESLGYDAAAGVAQAVFRDQPFAFASAVVRVPEPASLSLFGAGLIGLAGFWRRRRATC